MASSMDIACLQEDIVSAMALTGQIVMGQAIMVKSSEVRLVTDPPQLRPSAYAKQSMGCN